MKIQILRVISIMTSVVVALWLPLRAVGFPIPVAMNMAFDALVSVVSIINIYLNFKERDVPLSEWRSWINFGVALDLLSFIPLYSIGVQGFKIEMPWLKLNNLLAARHVWKIKAFLDEFDSLHPILFRLIPLGMTMPLLVHLISCSWIGLGSGSAGENPDKIYEYVRAIYWTITTLTTVGYGDIVPQTIAQILFALCVQITGVAVFGYVLSNVASLLSRMDAAREHHMDSIDKIETFMRSNHIPTKMRRRVRGYFRYLWDTHRGYQDRAIISDLPTKIQSELIMYINRKIIEKVPFFVNCDSDLLEDIMSCLEPHIYVPDEKIFHIDEPGDGLFLIHNGEVDIFDRNGAQIVTLAEGAFFGEGALISAAPRSATVRAKTYCDIYKLQREDFERVVGAYPEFKEHLSLMAKKRKAA